MTRVATAFSSEQDARTAGTAAGDAVASELAGAGVDLVFLFVTPEHQEAIGDAAAAIRAALRPRHLLGCVAGGVIAGERELEHGPALAVWAASLPGAKIETFHLQSDDGTVELPELGDASLVVLLVDPFTMPADKLVEKLNEAHPGVPVVGGIAAGAGRPDTQALVLGDEVLEGGVVVATVDGIPVEAVVSQGCAPLGPESVITRAEGNVVYELAGRPALERLRETIAGLTPNERRLAVAGLMAGLVIDENKPEYSRGDFLMRGLLGADDESGAIAIGERVRVGQTLRFHARDAAAADKDLVLALDETLGRPGTRAAGALLFTCNGRGSAMFGETDHDSRAVAAALGAPAVAGFFCGGEIGPVGGRTFLHGFTATLAVFLEPESG